MRPSHVLIGCAFAIGVSRLVLHAADADARQLPVRLTFTAVADSFQRATQQYDSLWAADGARMTRALEGASRLSFAALGDTLIHVQVFEGVSQSGTRPQPMKLRASYPLAIKKAALMHELGHRLQADIPRAPQQEHPQLFLWLHAAWADAYGATFADEQVAVEKGRGGVYPASWDSALALSPQQRRARWDSIRTTAR